MFLQQNISYTILFRLIDIPLPIKNYQNRMFPIFIAFYKYVNSNNLIAIIWITFDFKKPNN